MLGFTPNKEINFFIYHGTSSLSQSDFTINLYKDGVISNIDVRVESLGDGNYMGTFTPDDEGLWVLQLYQTSASTTRYTGAWQVSTAITGSLDFIRITINRIDEAIRRFFFSTQRL